MRRQSGEMFYPRRKTMKSFICKAVLAFAVASLMFSVSAKAQDSDGCSNATLKGDYATTISGEIYIPTGPGTFHVVQRRGVAMAHYDGAGKFTQVDFVLSDPLAPPPPGVAPTDPQTGFHNEESGTYTINKDCTGTATIHFPPFTDPATGKETPGAIITVHFVLSDHGRTKYEVVTSVTPPGASKSVPALILAESHKLGRVPED